MPRPAAKSEQKWLAYVAGFLGCVVFPGAFTMIAPVSVTRFERQGAEVVAHVKTNVFFAIPYRHVQVDGVTSVDDRYKAGELSKDDRYGVDSREPVRSEDQAFLVIRGRSGQAEVSVSPVNIRSALEKSRDFLAAPDQRELRLITVANWKFGVIVGGLLSPLTLLYLYSVVYNLGRSLFCLITGKKLAEPKASQQGWRAH